jgi:hypothetical protein
MVKWKKKDKQRPIVDVGIRPSSENMAEAK